MKILALGLAASLSAPTLMAAYPEEVLLDGPVGYWRLGEVGVVPEESALNLGTLGVLGQGNYLNRPTHEVEGAIVSDSNTAASFDGTGQLIQIPYSFDLNPAGSFSVEAWVKPDVALTGTALTSPLASLRRVDSSAEGWIFYQTPTGWNYRQGTTFDVYTVNLTGTTLIEVDKWYHLVATFDGAVVNLYVNGALEATVAESRFNPNSSIAMGIGGRGDNAFFFDGSVDEVALYPQALTAAEVAANYAAGTEEAPATPYADLIESRNPLGYWRLDEPDPGYPVAVNEGTAGEAADGTYLAGSTLNVIGPRPPAQTGFEADNGAVQLDQGIVLMPNLNLNSNTVTMMAWIKMDTLQPDWAGILFSRGGTTTSGLNLAPGGTQLRYHWNDAASSYNFDSGVEVPFGEWVLVGMVVEPTRAKLFVGSSFGFQIAENPVAHAVEEFNAPLRVGLDNGPRYFSGQVAEVAIFDKALSEARIRTLYSAGKGGDIPVIAVEPSLPAGNVYVGEDLELSIEAYGTPPFTYVWRRGTTVVGDNSPVLSLEGVTAADSGVYTVEVSNGIGSPISSQQLTLTVNPLAPPVIVSQPQPTSRYVSGTARFSVVAEGSPPLDYQWYFGEDELPNEDGPELIVSGLTEANAGEYWVEVSNPAGPTPSDTALLDVIVPPANTYASVVLTDEPTAFWRLGESSGEVAQELVGGFDGAYENFVMLGLPGALTDDPDTAASFDSGSLSRVQVPHSPELNTQTFTIELWAKVTGGQGVHRSPVTSRDDGPQRGYIFYADPGDNWQFWTGVGASTGWDVLGGATVEYDAWTHLVGTYDGTNKRFYVNGVEVSSNQSAVGVNTAQPLRIGAGATESPDGSFHFFGEIDEVAYYPYALAPERIAAHYGVGLGATTPPTFVTSPSSQAVLEGSTVTLRAQATGSLPISYKWQFGGEDVGEGPELVLANVTADNAGEYVVIATNPADFIESEPVTLTVVALPDMTYNEVILQDAPISYWRLNESSGTVAVDVIGGRNGTYNNGVVLGAPGAIGLDTDTAATFTSATQAHVEVPAAFELNGYFFTIEVWAKATGGEGTFRSPVTSRSDNPQDGYIFYAASNNTWEFWSGTGTQTVWDIIGGPAIVLGQWTHLAATYDGAIKRFYVNGEFRGSSSAAFGPNFFYPLRIGGGATEATPGNFFFEGDIDEVAYYDRALTHEELLIHYGLGMLGGAEPELSFLFEGGELIIDWMGGTLESAETIDGEWTAVAGAAPLTLSVEEGSMFFRVRQ